MSTSGSPARDESSSPQPRASSSSAIKSAHDVQRKKLDKLMENPDKEAYVPKPPKDKTLRPPKEIMKNVQGSSAGAGSGEFHVYKQSRRREYERLRLMDEKEAKERAQQEYNEWKESADAASSEKTAKNRAKRMKKKHKMRAGTKGSNNDNNINNGGGVGGDDEDGPVQQKRPIGRMEVRQEGSSESEDGEDNQGEKGSPLKRPKLSDVPGIEDQNPEENSQAAATQDNPGGITIVDSD